MPSGSPFLGLLGVNDATTVQCQGHLHSVSRPPGIGSVFTARSAVGTGSHEPSNPGKGPTVDGRNLTPPYVPEVLEATVV